MHRFRQACVVMILGAASFLVAHDKAPPSTRQLDTSLQKPTLTLVTGYCNCGECCGWKRSWFGFGKPVFERGSKKGEPKRVGVTALGTRARHGTIAADPAMHPLGERLYIPGYGVGIVEDIGGSIKGNRIDVWFPTHKKALQWGRRLLNVQKCSSDTRMSNGNNTQSKGLQSP